MRCDSGVIGEEHLRDEHFVHLRLGWEACQVEQATIASGMQVDSLIAEGITQQQGEQDAKKCRCEDAPLFNTTFDGEGVKGGAIMLAGASHFFMEGSDHPQGLGEAAYSVQECKQT